MFTDRDDELGELHRAIGRTWDRLAASTDAHTRAKLLIDAADLHLQMAEVHRGYGADPNPDEDGRDVADSIRCTARLLDALADVEFVAGGSLSRRHVVHTEFEAAAGPVLDRMAATPDVTERAELLKELHAAVVDVLGEHAAEVLSGLPYAPGMTGWHHQEPLPDTVSLRSFVQAVRILWRNRTAA